MSYPLNRWRIAERALARAEKALTDRAIAPEDFAHTLALLAATSLLGVHQALSDYWSERVTGRPADTVQPLLLISKTRQEIREDYRSVIRLRVVGRLL